DGFWTGEQNETIELNENQVVYLIADLEESVTDPTTVTVGISCPDDEGPEPGECPVDYLGTLDDGLGSLSDGETRLAVDFYVGPDEQLDVNFVKLQIINLVGTLDISFYD